MSQQSGGEQWTPPVHRRAPFWIAYFFVALVALTVIVAGGANAANVEVANETVDVDANTDTVYAEITNGNPTQQANLSVTMTATENGTETEIENQSLVEVPADDSTVVESGPVNGTANESVRVVAVLDNSTVPENNVSVETGTFQQVPGGGGGIGGAGTAGGIGILAVLGVGAFLLMRDD